MFAIAILIGVYSYLILALGLAGLLYKSYIVILSFLYVVLSAVWFRKTLIRYAYLFFERVKRVEKFIHNSSRLRSNNNNLLIFIFVGLIFVQALTNFVGALGPELGFDALWYHLTIPKIYLENHSTFYIPGGLLYYSLMPKLTEMLYIAALAINGEVLAKIVHFSFGILSSIALFKLSRELLPTKISLIAVIIFYSNLVVGWQSITAYVDLARTFFEIMALWGFVKWWKGGGAKWLIESAVMLGLAVSTKLLALGSLLIFTVLFIFLFFVKSPPRRSPFSHLRGVYITKNLFIYWITGLLIPLPWIIFSYINTGNPVYPFFTDIYPVGFYVGLINPIKFIYDMWLIFTQASDPISPVYIIFLPLALIYFVKLKPGIKIVALYSLFAIFVWYLTPRTGGGRFILPYLPAFSILAAGVLDRTKEKSLNTLLISIVLFISVTSIVYRGVANYKYFPVLFGLQTKEEFLSKNLNFSFGDFYDTDGYFKKNIKSTDKVLTYGFHNLYYIDFPYIDSSWVKKGDSFNYVAVQDGPSSDGLPKRFKDWELVYQNPKTNVKLYSKGGIKWSY